MQVANYHEISKSTPQVLGSDGEVIEVNRMRLRLQTNHPTEA